MSLTATSTSTPTTSSQPSRCIRFEASFVFSASTTQKDIEEFQTSLSNSVLDISQRYNPYNLPSCCFSVSPPENRGPSYPLLNPVFPVVQPSQPRESSIPAKRPSASTGSSEGSCKRFQLDGDAVGRDPPAPNSQPNSKDKDKSEYEAIVLHLARVILAAIQEGTRKIEEGKVPFWSQNLDDMKLQPSQVSTLDSVQVDDHLTQYIDCADYRARMARLILAIRRKAFSDNYGRVPEVAKNRALKSERMTEFRLVDLLVELTNKIYETHKSKSFFLIAVLSTCENKTFHLDRVWRRYSRKAVTAVADIVARGLGLKVWDGLNKEFAIDPARWAMSKDTDYVTAYRRLELEYSDPVATESQAQQGQWNALSTLSCASADRHALESEARNGNLANWRSLPPESRDQSSSLETAMLNNLCPTNSMSCLPALTTLTGLSHTTTEELESEVFIEPYPTCWSQDVYANMPLTEFGLEVDAGLCYYFSTGNSGGVANDNTNHWCQPATRGGIDLSFDGANSSFSNPPKSPNRAVQV